MYTPHRDYRFEYIWEAMSFIEEHDCSDCIFATKGEYPMCGPIATAFIEEEAIVEIDDRGDEGLICTKRVPTIAHPDQGRLF